jgi:hypothetical protein
MSSQADEVVASAAALAQMADHLDGLVARFRLQAAAAGGASRAAAGPGKDNVVLRRRAGDWTRVA